MCVLLTLMINSFITQKKIFFNRDNSGSNAEFLTFRQLNSQHCIKSHMCCITSQTDCTKTAIMLSLFVSYSYCTYLLAAVRI